MITIPFWLGIAAVIAPPVAFFFGICVMAWVAASHYDGDEQRSEPE